MPRDRLTSALTTPIYARTPVSDYRGLLGAPRRPSEDLKATLRKLDECPMAVGRRADDRVVVSSFHRSPNATEDPPDGDLPCAQTGPWFLVSVSTGRSSMDGNGSEFSARCCAACGASL